jgi:hypothetical protein
LANWTRNPTWIFSRSRYLSRVLARSAKWFVVAALVFTLGGHWAVLQMVAWAGMAANFSQTDSLPVAISKTFDGKNPCKLCKLVSAGKKAEKKSEAKFDAKKLDSFFAANLGFYFPPLKQSPASFVHALRSHLEVPLSPPPKSA